MIRYWTSDFHLGAPSIIDIEKRPFKNVDHQTDRLVTSCNQRVKDDVCNHVGDYCNYGLVKGVEGSRLRAKDYLPRFTGKWNFIEGNHDANNGTKSDCKFAFVQISRFLAFVSHYPTDNDFNEVIDSGRWKRIRSCAATTCDFVICGHVHGKWQTKYDYTHGLWMINVGIDVNRYMPVSDNEVIRIYEDCLKRKV